MSNVVVPSKAGNLAVLEVGLEVAVTLRLFPLGQCLQDPQEDLAVSEVVGSVVDSTADEVEVDSEEDSKIEEVMVEVVEEVLATKEVEASAAIEVVMEEIVVGILMAHPLMHPLVQEVVAEEVLAVVIVVVGLAEEGMVARDPQIATDRHLVVGMTRVVAVAHMKTDPVDIVEEIVVMGTVMELLVGVLAAIWSR